MHEDHPHFRAPENPDARIWRYLNLARFVALLTTRSVYFSRADQLGDEFEGTITRATIESYQDPRSPTSIPAFQDTLRRLREALRRNVAISCWHIATHESTAMWAQYAGRGSGIAVRSTYKRLQESLARWECTTYTGLVEYADYDTVVFDGNNLLVPFMHKRKEFESERELRVVVSRLPAQEGSMVLDYSVSMPNGLLAPVDLDTLVEAVVLAPQTPEWQFESLRALVAALGFRFPVERSSLDRAALLG